MKKLFIILAFASVSMVSMAQETDPTLKHSVATNSFWSNWFIQAGADWNAWYSNQEHGTGNPKSPFKKFRSNPGFSVAVGKWFTPGIGLRTKFQGIWGKSVYEGETSTSNKYWVLNEQVLLNLCNLIGGYNPNRVWSVIPFFGGGLGRSMTHDLYAMNLNAGLLNEFRLCDKLSLNVELGWIRAEADYDGIEQVYGRRGWDCKDNHVYGEIGFTYRLGNSKWNKVPDVDAIKALSQSQIDALNAQLNDANAENARLRNMLANQKPVVQEAPVAMKEFVHTPISVFFDINKTTVASQYDLVNVRALAKYAADNNSNVLVNGFADSATGSVERNQFLSEKRAETVADELVKMGVSRDKIQTKGNGGVDDLSPISFNRRATVQVVE